MSSRAIQIGPRGTDLLSCSVSQAIHRVRKHSAQIACEALAAFIRDRLIPIFAAGGNVSDDDQIRLEKACVTFVLFSVNSKEDLVAAAIGSLQYLLDRLTQTIGNLLSAQAVHAMQTLIWKACGSDMSTTDAWLQLLRHPAFDGAGQANKARIGR